jgi:hypothetical protein
MYFVAVEVRVVGAYNRLLYALNVLEEHFEMLLLALLLLFVGKPHINAASAKLRLKAIALILLIRGPFLLHL